MQQGYAQLVVHTDVFRNGHKQVFSGSCGRKGCLITMNSKVSIGNGKRWTGR